MELYAKGQLSFLILNCLLERDFYGLDFISEIYDKSDGRIDLKKPSVYSNLTRMEKQGYVSSYLKSSDLGPNRKYYSITEKGRSFYQELKSYFERNNIDVFRDFKDLDENDKVNIVTNENNYNQFNHFLETQPPQNSVEQEAQTSDNSEDEDNDYFDFSSLESDNIKQFSDQTNTNQTEKSIIKEQTQDNKVDTNSYSIKSLFTSDEIKSNEKDSFVNQVEKHDASLEKPSYSNASVEANRVEEKQEESKKDDAVFLDNNAVEEYNRRLYDISKDINRYKRKKSFAEDQIAFSVENSSPISEANERTRTNIEDFKNSILDNKGKFAEKPNNYYDLSKQMSYKYNKSTQSYQDVLNQKSKQNEEHIDDGKFITGRVDYNQIGRAKKIEPPRLKIVTEQPKDNYKMPPPKRDTSIDPSHKEILSKLYSKTRSGDSSEVREDALYDYNDLQDFYKDQNIPFNVYKKPAEKTEHNTNKLYLIVSIVCFLTASVLSAVLYGILFSSSLINSATNFLYILLPSLVIIDICIAFYNYKKYKSWVPSPMIPQWKMWLITLVVCALVVGLNFVCGMTPARFAEFATTTILPILLALIVLPFRYYLKRFLLIKYWR